MLKPFQFVLAVIRAILVILLMVIFVGIYMLSLIVSKHTAKRAFRLRRNYSRIAIRILNLHVEIIGEKSDVTPAIYVSNHRSFSDPVVISLFSDVFVIAKAEVANMPIINKAVEMTGIIYVKREEKSSRAATRETLVKTIKENKNVLIFAEGTVSGTKEILPLKYGSFIAAADNDINIIPIALEYQSKRDLWIVPSFLGQHVQQFGKWRTNCRITYGEPLLDKDGVALHDKTQNWLEENVSMLQEGWSKAF